ncbi:MAG: glycosyltransferase family 2 protein [Patescibacteria group bacterium]|nr:glycosyltransferase family 2 protein [Patescibacteria group bacterium]
MIKALLKFLKLKEEKQDYIQFRIYEIFPGFMAWFTLIFCVLISLIKPLWGIYFIIVLDVYWVIRIWYLFIFLVGSWMKYMKAKKVDWKSKRLNCNNWEDYIHLVALPTYKEPYKVVKETFDKLMDCEYPKDKMIIALGGEEGDRENFLNIANQIKSEFYGKFKDIVISVHPRGVSGEIPGKGSNMYHIGTQMYKYFLENNIDISKVIISMFDIETWPDSNYFNCLTYEYLTCGNPERYSYQPLVLFNNNVWKSNPIIRVVAHSTTYWLLTDLSRAERLFTFSSHSMSFKALVEVGFHPRDIVTEDTRIFLHCLNYFNGNYRVRPIYTPVSMQTVDVGGFFESLKNQYIQIRRWGWGVEHFPWMMKKLVPNKKIPFAQKFKYLFNQAEGTYSWATLPLLILIMGRLPIFIADKTIHYNVMIHNAPILLERIMNFGLVGIFAVAFLNFFLLPKKPKNISPFIYLVMFAQWVLFPFTMIFFGSIPALEAQTRLMIGGKYRLGFQVTKKT